MKSKRYKNSPEKYAEAKQNLLEEIADVSIMTEQLEQIFGPEKITEIKDYKINRTKKYLK